MTQIIILMAALFLMIEPCQSWSIEPVKNPYQVRFGTLELTSDIKRRYVFKYGSMEEAFDLTDIVARSGRDFPGLPNLKEIGFRTEGGEVYKYGNLSKQLYLEKFIKDNPGGNNKPKSWIFSGLLDEDLEIRLEGQTPVCRVDIQNGGGIITLWENLPNQPVVPQKAK
ncbi:hypothetical protein EI77_02304 [Prosthecobacter fusiformis]|uniref:Uncharacterized protein n=1 Tax=Prosthecobacter fusiformis TaxID=48464 RepID=A0A4R7RZ40_9BACT|nr:hypothetical protein [Prosthecobacter fusiformis]TDU71182.1 hypothetical protein EI77_02304 [Prosthecobacter fusiformis]